MQCVISRPVSQQASVGSFVLFEASWRIALRRWQPGRETRHGIRSADQVAGQHQARFQWRTFGFGQAGDILFQALEEFQSRLDFGPVADEGIQLFLALPIGLLDASSVLQYRALPLFGSLLQTFALQLRVSLCDQYEHLCPECFDVGDDIRQARDHSGLPVLLPVFGQIDATVRRIGYQAQSAGWAIPGESLCLTRMTGAALWTDVLGVAHVVAVADIAKQGRRCYFDECQADHMPVDVGNGQALGWPNRSFGLYSSCCSGRTPVPKARLGRAP